MKTILIDDEILARNRLKRLLNKHASRIELIAEAENGQHGLDLINQLNPELIFLDVEMPVLNGFEMLSHLKLQPKIIFTTAFENYAIKAFEENSIDYLLKPVEEERLDKAIEKLIRLRDEKQINQSLNIESLLKAFQPKKEMKALPVKIGDRTLLIKPENIIYFEAKEKYVSLFTDDLREFITDLTITMLEEKLPFNFLRIHRAIIINTDKIKEMHRGFNSTHIFMMQNAGNIKISSGRSFNENIKTYFQF